MKIGTRKIVCSDKIPRFSVSHTDTFHSILAVVLRSIVVGLFLFFILKLCFGCFAVQLSAANVLLFPVAPPVYLCLLLLVPIMAHTSKTNTNPRSNLIKCLLVRPTAPAPTPHRFSNAVVYIGNKVFSVQVYSGVLALFIAPNTIAAAAVAAGTISLCRFVFFHF